MFCFLFMNKRREAGLGLNSHRSQPWPTPSTPCSLHVSNFGKFRELLGFDSGFLDPNVCSPGCSGTIKIDLARFELTQTDLPVSDVGHPPTGLKYVIVRSGGQ